MVKTTARFLFLVALLSAAFNLPAKEPGDYKIGEAAEEDISTPIPLVVINAEATRVLKLREAERIPVHLRFSLGLCRNAK